MTNQELKDLSERLIKLAANSGLAGKVVIDYQGSTSECSTSDQAPNPLVLLTFQNILPSALPC